MRSVVEAAVPEDRRDADEGTIIETSPGRFKVGRHVIKDIHNYGTLDVSGIVRSAKTGQPLVTTIPLRCFKDSGGDLATATAAMG